MARTQATTYAGLSLSTANVGAPIWETPLDTLAKNNNRLYGQWSPSIMMTRTIDNSLQYYNVAAATADHIAFAIRLPVVGNRAFLTSHPRMLAENAPLGGDGKSKMFGVESVGASSLVWGDFTASSSYTWFEDDQQIAEIGSTGLDIVGFHIRTDDNSPGYVRMRGLECHLKEYSGALAAGIDESGVIPADTDQWDADSPLSVGNVRDMDTSHTAMHESWNWPVCSFVDSITSPLENAATAATSYEVIYGPVFIPTRPGEDIASITYSALADRDTGSSTDCKIRVSTRYGPTIGSSEIDSNEHTVFGTVTTSNWKTASNWADDSLTVSSGGCYLFIEAKGAAGPETTRLLSFLAWATGR